MTSTALNHSSMQRQGSRQGQASRQGTARPRLRITPRGRAVLSAILLGPLVAAILALSLNGGAATAAGELSGADFQYLTVEPGQSLWQLAESLAPDADPREVISDLVRLNGLQDSVVHPGERLAIPGAYSK